MRRESADLQLALSLQEEKEAAAPRVTLDDGDRESRLRGILGLLPHRAVRPRSARAQQPPGNASADRSRLVLRLQHYGLLEREVRGDGNCQVRRGLLRGVRAASCRASRPHAQFRAVSDQLYRSEAHHAEVRSIAADRLRRHPALYSAFVAEVEFDTYVARMARDGTWGDNVTLKAIADHFGAEVRLKQPCVCRSAPQPNTGAAGVHTDIVCGGACAQNQARGGAHHAHALAQLLGRGALVWCAALRQSACETAVLRRCTTTRCIRARNLPAAARLRGAARD